MASNAVTSSWKYNRICWSIIPIYIYTGGGENKLKPILEKINNNIVDVVIGIYIIKLTIAGVLTEIVKPQKCVYYAVK